MISGWLVALLPMRDEWKFVWTTHGAQCVMTFGELLMPMWSADSWVSLHQVWICVNKIALRLFLLSIYIIILQEQQPISSPGLVKVQDPSTWMMFPVLVLRVDWWTADTLPTITASILKMLVSVVEVEDQCYTVLISLKSVWYSLS